MLTRKAKYAIKALIHLADQPTGEPMLIADLSRAINAPRKFLELILLELKSRGLVQSKKGRGGGYFLNRAPEEISVALVVRHIDGPLAPVTCVSQMAYRRCEECLDEATCGVRLVMKDVRDAIAEVLDHTSLADVLHRIRAISGEGFLD